MRPTKGASEDWVICGHFEGVVAKEVVVSCLRRRLPRAEVTSRGPALLLGS